MYIGKGIDCGGSWNSLIGTFGAGGSFGSGESLVRKQRSELLFAVEHHNMVLRYS